MYSNSIIDDKKICVYLDIDDLFSKTLNNQLKEYPYVSDYSNCDYLAVIFTSNDTSYTTTISGINLKNQLNTEVQYYLFKFNKKFTNEIINILQNANTESNEKAIGRKDYYFTKRINQYGTIQQGDQKEQDSDIDRTINKLQEYIFLLKHNKLQQSLMYNYNVLLPLSIEQEKTDTSIQSAKAISEKIMSNIVNDIMDIKTAKQYKQYEKKN